MAFFKALHNPAKRAAPVTCRKKERWFSIAIKNYKALEHTLKQTAAHVRFGSKADISEHTGDVRFTPKSRHWLSALGSRQREAITLLKESFGRSTRLIQLRRDLGHNFIA